MPLLAMSSLFKNSHNESDENVFGSKTSPKNRLKTQSKTETESEHTNKTIDITESSSCTDEPAPASSSDFYDAVASTSTKRKVEFSAVAKRRKTISRTSYTREERQRCWYTAEEIQKMALQRDKVIARMEAGKSETNNRPYRGLEGYTRKGARYMNRQIYRLIDAVMDEQDRQWLECFDDPMQIASISRTLSAESNAKARQVGFEDEQDAIIAAASDSGVADFGTDTPRQEDTSADDDDPHEVIRNSRNQLRENKWNSNVKGRPSPLYVPPSPPTTHKSMSAERNKETRRKKTRDKASIVQNDSSNDGPIIRLESEEEIPKKPKKKTKKKKTSSKVLKSSSRKNTRATI